MIYFFPGRATNSREPVSYTQTAPLNLYNDTIMKTIPLIASLCLVLCSHTEVQALSTPGYTFIPVCNPSITISAISATNDCFSLTSSVLHPGAPDSYYSWSFGDGTPNESGRTLNHCYASETVPGNTTRTVTLSYFNTALNCAGSATATLNVSVIPASPCPNVPPDYTLAASSVTVWAGFAIPEMVTSFDFGDGTPATYNSTHTYTACGNYIVRISHWDMNLPSQVCHTFAAINISCSTPIGLPETPAGQFMSVFPNPASDLIHVKAGEIVKTIRIADPLGKTVLWETDIHAQEAVIRTSHLPAGTYFMTIAPESDAPKTVLFVKH